MTKLEFTMIRSTTPDDTTALIALAEATGLFPPSALELLRQMLTDSLGGNSDTDPFWITDDDNGPVGVAYCEPQYALPGRLSAYYLSLSRLLFLLI